MFYFRTIDVVSNVNLHTVNVIEIPNLNVDNISQICLVKDVIKEIQVIVQTGSTLKFSWNIIANLFTDFIDYDKCFSLTFKTNFKPKLCQKVLLSLLWSPLYSNTYDYSSSVYDYFSSDVYISVNDCLKIPLNELDKVRLFEECKVFHIGAKYIFVKVISISSFESGDGTLLFKFDKLRSKLVMNIGSCQVKKIFDPIDVCCWKSVILSSKCLQTFLKKNSLNELLTPKIFHVKGEINSGKGSIVNGICANFGLRVLTLNYTEVLYHSLSAIDKKFDNFILQMKEGNYFGVHLEDFDGFFKKTETAITRNSDYDERMILSFRKSLDNIFSLKDKEFICFVSTQEDLPIEIEQFVIYTVYTDVMNTEERLDIIKYYLPTFQEDNLIQLEKLSRKIPRIRLIKLLEKFLDKNNIEVENVVKSFKIMISASNQKAMEMERVTWKDIGGLDEIIQEVKAIVKLTLGQHKPVSNLRIKKTGILLYGEPGTGKTLLAKTVASECTLNFISVKGPELLNMYVGQTEANIRSLFDRVRNSEPCLLFCDELDSLAPIRGISGDSGGVMDRVVSQLALEFDSLNSADSRILIMAATNRPDLIDPALLRSGRFDKVFHVGGEGGNEKERILAILRSQSYKLNLAEDLSLERIADELMKKGKSMTGAMIYGLVSDAVMCSIRRIITEQNIPQDYDKDVVLTWNDFLSAISRL